MTTSDTVSCECGKELSVWCGFHSDPEACQCIGTICSECLQEMLREGKP